MLQHPSKKKSNNAERKGWKCFKEMSSTKELSQAKTLIIHSVQHEAFKEELKCLEGRQTWPKQNKLKKLNPGVDKDGLLVSEVVFLLLTCQKKKSTL